MKTRFITFLICGAIVFSIFTVNGNSDYIEPENRIFVSALGVSQKDGKIKLFAEATESDDINSGVKIKRHIGEGETFLKSVTDITNGVFKQISLRHCAVILLSKNITAETFNEITDYVKDGGLPFSVLFAMCEEPEKFFGTDLPFGYDVAELIKNNRNNTQSRIKCSYTDYINQSVIFGIPVIKKQGEKNNICGMCFLKSGQQKLFINNAQSRIYSIITDTFTGGRINLKTDVLKITDTRLKISAQRIDVTVITENEINTFTASKQLNKEITELTELFYKAYGKDFTEFICGGEKLPKISVKIKTG